jgi:hypothetical protein
MAPIRITVEGVGGVKLSSNDELGRFLEKKKVQCLIDSDGDQVYGFDSLVDGGTYTLGPPQRQQQQQQQQQNGKLLCCSRIFVFNVLFLCLTSCNIQLLKLQGLSKIMHMVAENENVKKIMMGLWPVDTMSL